MATGRRLIQSVHSVNWAKYRFRGENVKRGFQSDRMKVAGRILKKQLRTQLKRETRELIMEI